MCRSIVRLREGADLYGRAAMEAAALLRKVSGFRDPSPANREVFGCAVAEVALATSRLMGRLRIGGQATRPVLGPDTGGP